MWLFLEGTMLITLFSLGLSLSSTGHCVSAEHLRTLNWCEMSSWQLWQFQQCIIQASEAKERYRLGEWLHCISGELLESWRGYQVHASYVNRGRIKQTKFGCLADQFKLSWSGFSWESCYPEYLYARKIADPLQIMTGDKIWLQILEFDQA